MKYLLSVSICLLLASCAAKVPVQEPKAGEKPLDSRSVKVLWLSEKDSNFRFLTEVTIYGKEVKGILFLRKMTESHYKTLFMAQGALKLFEMDLMPDTFVVHERAEQINKPLVLKTLARDISLITFQAHRNFTPASEETVNDQLVCRVPGESENLFYTFNRQNELKELVTATKEGSETVTVTFDEYSKGHAGKIRIQHHKFRLKINLSLLQE